MEVINVRKYGTSKKLIALPNDLQNEMRIGDELVVERIDRDNNEIVYRVKDNLKTIEEYLNGEL